MSSVYDDIARLIDAEEAELDKKGQPFEETYRQAKAHADAERDQAYEFAEADYLEATAPLDAERDRLEALRAQVQQLADQSAGGVPDPQAPSAPASSAADLPESSTPSSPAPLDSTGTPSTDSSPTPAPAAAEQSTLPDAPSEPTPTSEPEPSTPSGDDSQPPLPTASPDDALIAARGVDATQPIAVPLTTGGVRVVTAGDIQAAADPDIEDDALTTTQMDLRRSNSDWP